MTGPAQERVSTARRRVELSGAFDPLEVTARLAVSALVTTHVVYEQPGRWWYAGGVRGSVTMRRDRLDVSWEGTDLGTIEVDGRPVAALGTAVARFPVPVWSAYGWVSFDLGQAHAGHLELSPEQRLGHIVVPEAEVEVTSSRIRVNAAEPLMTQLLRVLRAAPEAVQAPEAQPMDVAAATPARYQRAVGEAVQRIESGELEKVILSRPLRVPFAVDFPATYVRGRQAHTPARSFLLDMPGLRAAGFSPETVAEVDTDGWVATQPLAGTCGRLGDALDDERLVRGLTTDPKEIYEHAVSVRLADQELRDLCDPTTVVVEEFMSVKARGSVHHLGSRVRGRLRNDRTCWDALEVLMPAVTASGIPKLSAYQLIADYEETPRGLYSGTVLRATSAGMLDAALVLRTVYTDRGATWLRAGAGIVAASRPQREYEETCEKLLSVAPYLIGPDKPRCGIADRVNGLLRAPDR